MKQTKIISRLQGVARLEQLWHIAYAASMAITIGVALLLALSLLEWAFDFTTTTRTVLYFGLIGSTALTFGLYGSRPLATLLGLVKSEQPQTTALRVGNVYPEIRDTLSNAIQLSEEANSGSSDLTAYAIEESMQNSSDKDFSVIIDKKRTKRGLFAMISSMLIVAILTFSIAPLSRATLRLLDYKTSYVPAAPFVIKVSAKNSSVLRGTDTQIDVAIDGIAPQELTLWIKEEHAERFTPYTVEIDTAMNIAHQLPGLSSSVKFYATAEWFGEDVKSNTGSITVVHRPLVRSLVGRVLPPRYTGLPPVLFTDEQADITALKGSTVNLSINSNKKLKGAKIVIEIPVDSVRTDTIVKELSVNGESAVGGFVVQRSGTYHIELTDEVGDHNIEPVRYGIVALTDGYPTIAMVEPTKDVDIDPSGLLPISVAVADDYGFTSLTLYYRLTKSRFSQPEERFTTLKIPVSTTQTSADVGYAWDLNKVGITPEDEYEFYLEVADNDVVAGPKKAKTSSYKVRLPSLEEVFAEADQVQSQVEKELEKLVKESEQVRREADELQREMQKQQAQNKQQLDWADKKKADEITKRQQELQKKMESVTQKLEDMTQKLEQNKAMSPETIERYKELQELMKQVQSPELEKMRKDMEEAMKNISPEKMEEMMKNFKFDEEQFRKNIERTMNLLKRIQAEQKADELAKRAEKLAEKQDELRKRAENTNANDTKAKNQLAKEQNKLSDDLKELAKDAKALEEMMKEIGADMPTDMMRDAQEELDAKSTQNDMQQAQEQMQKGDMQQASKNQQRASQNMQRFAQQMQQLGKQMRRNANKEAMRDMQRGMQDMVELSKQQEELMQQMRGMDPSSQQFSQAAQQQQRMQQAMQNMANSMMQLSQKSTAVSPELAKDLGDALQSMQNSVQQMQNRNGQMTAREQGNAMSSMNEAAKKMSDALGQMMQGEGSGQGGQGSRPGMGKGKGQSPFERLQQLADDQQGINQGMQQLGQGGTGNQMSEQKRAEMGRLAAQQGKALKAMQELEKEQRSSSGSKKPIGDLKQITEDMQEVLSDMQSGLITPETRMRQERILSRLLNASKSINERDYEKTRESRSGQDVRRESPTAFDLTNEDPTTLKAKMDALRKGYTKDYEDLIRRYFEVLQQQRTQTAE